MSKVTWGQIGAKENAVLSPAFVHNDVVYTAGCLGDKSGEFSKDIEVQTELAIKNLEKVLAASNSSLDNCLRVTVFIAKGKHVAKVNEVYKKYFKTKPARACVVVGFPNKKVLVEIEAVAYTKTVKAKL
ncbi:unnamed protein product [[Candida] boidinii]|uniref:Unnamed protein product n=1 Tax=Candida boidinii TaxID=5477 RepID=A0A9W6WIY8_CANBO|nr:hypothetical protein B5S30_g1712 [[Candida] boidinii]OWB82644.1 hypothetical protein B5S33_g1272 [[Candida] boidinii]GME72928.1 unnamed protein product [[Candida] boidinii]GMF99541.1 unnamed protein product [[Candida] boidinii]